MADGRIAFMCSGGISLVFAVAAAVRAIGLDTPDPHLDGEHHPHVHRLASAHSGISVCASGLGDAAGIRSRRDNGRDHFVAPSHSAGSWNTSHTQVLKGHGFSRAAKGTNQHLALAAEGCPSDYRDLIYIKGSL